MRIKKIIERKKLLLQVGLKPVHFNPHLQWAAAVMPLTQKPKIITICP